MDVGALSIENYSYTAEQVGENTFVNVESIHQKDVITSPPVWFVISDDDTAVNPIRNAVFGKSLDFLKYISPNEFVRHVYQFRRREAFQSTKKVHLFNCGLTRTSNHPGHLCLKNYYWFWCLIAPVFWPCLISTLTTQRGIIYGHTLTFLLISSLLFIFQDGC